MSDDQEAKPRRRGPLGRRRQSNVAGGRRGRHEVKTSAEEEGRLVALAEARGGISIPRLLVEAALAAESKDSGLGVADDRLELLTQLFGIHRLLGALGNNLNQIAKATNATGRTQPDLEHALARVRQVAERIDSTLDQLAERR